MWFGVISAGLLLVALVGFSVIHRDYYFSPLHEQALHPEHSRLRSSGSLGLLCGFATAGCIFVNLLYLARRQWLSQSLLGSLRAWMNLHVVSGLLAGGLLLLHSAWTLRSVSGTMAAIAIAIVLATGIIGRFVHAMIPRTLEGRERDYGDLLQSFRQLRESLAEQGFEIALPSTPTVTPPKSALTALRQLLARRAELRREKATVLADLARHSLDEDLAKPLAELFRQRRTLAQYHDLRRLMQGWRFLHRWLALVMVGAALVHIVLAVKYSTVFGS